jgi:hypothetical protein
MTERAYLPALGLGDGPDPQPRNLLGRALAWLSRLPPLDGDGCESEPYDTHQAVED